MGYKKIKVTHISLHSLQQDHRYSYDIFYQYQKGVFKTFIKDGESFDNLHKKTLEEKKIENLYIKYEDHKLYENDLQDYIKDIIKDKKSSIKLKSQLLQGLTADVMNELFKGDINTGKIEQVETIVYDTVSFLLDQPKAIKEMLKITKFDYYTYTHCVNVYTYALGFSVFLGIDKKNLSIIGMAAIMHDIGKRKVSNNIINKNGKLTAQEFEEIKKHSSFGVDILQEMGYTNDLLLIVIEQHHEKIDGSGYPYGLSMDQIHLYSRILSIVDIFDALTTRRSYKGALKSFEAFNIMYNHMKSELDLKLLERFMKFMNQ